MVGWVEHPQEGWEDTGDFWDCLAESNDEAFQVGKTIAIECISDSPGSLEQFLVNKAEPLRKIAQRLKPEEALLCVELFEKDISSLSFSFGNRSSGEAIIGAALGELGRRLSAEVALQKHQEFIDRLKVDRRLGTLANSLQAMAAFANVPGFASQMHRLDLFLITCQSQHKLRSQCVLAVHR